MTTPSQDPTDPLRDADKLFDQFLYAALQSKPEYRTRGDLPALAIAHAHAADRRLSMLHSLRRWQTAGLATTSIALLAVVGMVLQWIWSDNAGSFAASVTADATNSTSTSTTTLTTNEWGAMALIILIGVMIVSSLWKTLELDPAV